MHSVLYISTSVWVLHTQKTGWNMHFQHFQWQKTSKKFTRLGQISPGSTQNIHHTFGLGKKFFFHCSNWILPSWILKSNVPWACKQGIKSKEGALTWQEKLLPLQISVVTFYVNFFHHLKPCRSNTHYLKVRKNIWQSESKWMLLLVAHKPK